MFFTDIIMKKDLRIAQTGFDVPKIVGVPHFIGQNMGADYAIHDGRVLKIRDPEGESVNVLLLGNYRKRFVEDGVYGALNAIVDSEYGRENWPKYISTLGDDGGLRNLVHWFTAGRLARNERNAA